MFKYTPSKEIVHKYNTTTDSMCKYDQLYFMAIRIIGTTRAYFECGDFWRHYLHTEYYSVTKRKTVPVNGILVPVTFFKELEI